MKHTGDYELDRINMLEQECADLEEENKKLKEDYKVLGILNDEIRRVNENLREENKKLKSDLSECECSMHYENDEVGYRKRECKKLNIIIENTKIEQEADRKHIEELEEENKKLKEELEKLRTDNIYEEGLYD